MIKPEWIAIQSSKAHFNARCKLGNKVITLNNYCVCAQVCCITSVSIIAVMNLCMGVIARVCVNLDSYHIEPKSLCMTDCFVCLTTIEKGSISVLASLSSLCLSRAL